MLARAERLHRELFRPAGVEARVPAWEPPVDVLETEREVIALVALPGVNPDHVKVTVDGNELVFAGTRVLPAELGTAVIHRLEQVDQAVAAALEPEKLEHGSSIDAPPQRRADGRR